VRRRLARSRGARGVQQVRAPCSRGGFCARRVASRVRWSHMFNTRESQGRNNARVLVTHVTHSHRNVTN
jgi:hypothetical protein